MANTIKNQIRKQLISEHGGLFSAEVVDEQELKRVIVQILEDIVKWERVSLSEQEKKRIIGELVIECVGFGPIDAFLKDPQITGIMINGPKKIYIERSGLQELSSASFDSEEALMHIIYKILAPTRRRVDESYPYTDASLKDGSRVNIIIPPLALDGPVVTIRKFLKEIKKIEDLINFQTMDWRMGDFLIACIRAKANIVFSGATGAGKTTTLNVLSSYIDEDERIVTIEDTAELRLAQEHVVRLETKQPTIEGRGEVTIRDLFKNSLRMRPDRIILGEIRGQEALDMLQAICSGHTGSLSVIHANSPQDVIYRLETMILASGVPISADVVHRQIAAGINLIVQQEQLSDGSRKITHITQVNGLKDGRAVLEDLFIFEIEKIDGQGRVHGKWRYTGITPAVHNLFKKSGVNLPGDIFRESY